VVQLWGATLAGPPGATKHIATSSLLALLELLLTLSENIPATEKPGKA
jgi:hypothetical protein